METALIFIITIFFNINLKSNNIFKNITGFLIQKMTKFKNFVIYSLYGENNHDFL